jgi:hypothetical protein
MEKSISGPLTELPCFTKLDMEIASGFMTDSIGWKKIWGVKWNFSLE